MTLLFQQLGVWEVPAKGDPRPGRPTIFRPVPRGGHPTRHAVGGLLPATHPEARAARGVAGWRTSTEDRCAGWPGCPGAVEAGEVTGQAALDAWVRHSTGGILRGFPVDCLMGCCWCWWSG